MISTEEKTILFFRPYARHAAIFEHLAEKSNLKLLFDHELDTPSYKSGKIQNINQIVDISSCRQKGEHESHQRIEILTKYLMNKMEELPFSKHFHQNHFDNLKNLTKELISQIFANYFAIHELHKKINLNCLVCSPSSLARHRGAIFAAQELGIPTVHLNHASAIHSHALAPELADTAIISDEISRLYFEDGLEKIPEVVVTGFPNYTSTSGLSFEELTDDNIKNNARKELGLDPETSVITYAGNWYGSTYVTSTIYLPLQIKAFTDLIRFMIDEKTKGEKVHLIVRQHPFILDHEHEEAYLQIAEELGFSDITVINDKKDAVFSASDIIVVDGPGSFSYDCFAAARPVVTVEYVVMHTKFAMDRIIDNARVSAHNSEIFLYELTRLKTDKEYAHYAAKKGFSLLEDMRPISQENSLREIADFFNRLLQ